MDNYYDYAGSESGQFGEAPDTGAVTGQQETNSPRTGGAKIAHLLFIAALFLLPFIFIPIPGWSISVGKVVVTALLVLSAGAAVFGSMFSKRELSLPKTYSILILGVFGMLVLSTVFSSSVSASLFGTNFEVGTFYTTAIALVLALVAPIVFTTKKQLVSAVGALFLGAGVLGLFHLIRLFAGPEFLSFGYFTLPASTPAGSWNDLGILFGVTYLISLVSVVFGSLPRQAKMLLTIVHVVSLAFVLIVNFQLLSMLLAIATLGILATALVLKRGEAVVPSTISLGFLLLISVFSGVIGAQMGNMFGISYAEIRPNWSSTSSLVGAGLSDFKNVILGSGPNTFTYLYQAERSPEVIESDFWAVDFAFSTGIMPTFAVTLGLIGVLAMLALTGYLGLLLVRTLRETSGDALLVTIAVAAGFAALFLWLLSILYVFSGMIFFLMLALTGISVAALTQMGRLQTVRFDSEAPVGSVVGLAGVILCAGLVVPALMVSASRTMYGQAVIQANLAEDVEGIAAAQAKVRQAALIERNDAFARTETEFGRIRIQEFLSRENTDESDIAPFVEVVSEVRDAALRAVQFNPANYLNWVNEGLVFETLGLLEAEGAFEEAALRYAQARELNPTNPEVLLIQARLERVRENMTEAEAFAEEAIALKGNYADAYLFLADIDLAGENTAAAIAHIEEAIEKIPNSAFLKYQLGLVHYSQENYADAIEALSSAIGQDPQYANARYFRALSYVYGENDRDEALQDLRFISTLNAENEVLQAVIANVEAGNDPLEGIAEDDPALPSAEEEQGSGTNESAVSDLEQAGNPENQQPTTPPATQGTEDEAGAETAE